MTTRQWAMIAVVSVLWGGSFFFNAIAVPEIPAFTLVSLRVGGGALVLTVAAVALGYRLPATPNDWRDFAVMGALANAMPFVLIVFAQARITSGVASVLNASTPLWTVLIAHWLTTDDKATPQRMLGVGVGIAGVGTLVGLTPPGPGSGAGLGMAAMIGATICYGFAGLWGRRFKATPPLITAAAQLVCSTVMLAPLALIFEHPFARPAPSVQALAAVAGLAVLSTALAFVIFFRVMAEAGATNAMLVTLLVPVSATLLGVLVLHEPLTAHQIAGGVLIGVALLIIDGRAWAALRHQRA